MPAPRPFRTPLAALAAVLAVLAATAVPASAPAGADQAPDYFVIDADAPPESRVPKFLYMFDEPVAWPGTIAWKYNPAGAPAAFADTATAVSHLQAALDQWSAVCGVEHAYQGTTTTAPDARIGGQPDYQNVVGWAPLEGQTAGVTWLWYATQNGVPRLVDGDIILSPTRVTGTSAMHRVAVHEWGHQIGVGHSDQNGAVMSGPDYSNYNNLVTLTDDDKRGCRCLYGPAPGQSAGYLCSLPREINFGNVPAGSLSAPNALTLTNQGNAAITLGAAGVTSGGFALSGCAAGTVLQSGQACVLSVRFAPTEMSGYSATLTIPVAGESQAYRISLMGTGVQPAGPVPSLAPSTATFASQTVGTTSAPMTLTLSNAGTGLLTIFGFAPGGAHAGDFNRAGTCSIGTPLGGGASCTIVVTFTPSAIGTRSASLGVDTDAGSVLAALSGTGAAPPAQPSLGASPPMLAFGNQAAGTQSATQSVTVTNAGGGTLTLSSVALGGANAAEFSRTGTCNAGTSLGAAQACTTSVRFTPLSAGAKAATLAIASNAGGASIPLSGTGVAVAASPSTVVEYYHAAYDHYFVTIGAAEIAALDTGVFQGWARTGFAFKAHATAQAGFAPICRFYLPPGHGDSHFYSASPAECQVVQQQNPAFVLESTAVMYLAIPDWITGACPAGTDPVYRAWNQRPDTNHRYTSVRSVRDAMVALGYVAEGSGPDLVTFCAPR